MSVEVADNSQVLTESSCMKKIQAVLDFQAIEPIKLDQISDMNLLETPQLIYKWALITSRRAVRPGA